MNTASLFTGIGCLGFIALSMIWYALRDAVVITRLVVGLIFLCFMVVGYWQFGAFNEWSAFTKQELAKQQARELLRTANGPQTLIAQLKQALQRDPTSARGWYLLGRLYVSQEAWRDASEAFTEANHLKPNEVDITVNLAQALWYVNNQQFNEQIRQLWQEALRINPDQTDALAMLAMDNMQNKQYAQAINYWQRLLKIVPQQSEDALAIQRAIVKAKQKGDIK